MLKAKVNYPLIDVKKTQEEIHRMMVRRVTDACKRWVLTAANGTPVVTGAAKATFIKLAIAARAALSITPRRRSRIPLGIANSRGELHVSPGKTYGWTWETTVEHVPFVEANYGMIQKANSGLREQIDLPAPVIKNG